MLLPFMKIFNDATRKVSGSCYVTSNSYVHQIFGIGGVINGYTKHNDNSISSMAPSKKKLVLGDVINLNQLQFAVVVLDPRQKRQYVEQVAEEKFVYECH